MLVALGVAAVLAFGAYRARLLTAIGAGAAALVGAAAVLGGAGWVVLLLAFFASANALSRWRRDEREHLIDAVVEKGDRRDAAQVLANGLVFAIAAIGATLGEPEVWRAIGAGAIATATADTWGTEVGTVVGGTPHHVLSGRAVPPGTSGGVSLAGTAATFAGAVLAAAVVMLMKWDVPFAAVTAGGIAGSMIDSVLGATIQERRWCTQCDLATERHRHRCGTATVRRGGIPSFNNDLVNLTSILAGGAVTWALA